MISASAILLNFKIIEFVQFIKNSIFYQHFTVLLMKTMLTDNKNTNLNLLIIILTSTLTLFLGERNEA